MCDSRIEIGKARLRSGFALPFALVLTGITLLVIGAGAAHIVSMMNLTREYLSRTRCRLAAQSAIESVKQDVNTAVESYTGGSSVGIVDAVGTHVASSVNGLLNGLTYVTETNIDGCVVHVRCGQATDVVGGVNASIPIYATAELSLGGRTTQVTLQERVCFNMSQSHVFDYAYFANNVGHLEGQMIRINGDVRSNGSFTIDNATINGYVLASGSVTLKNSPKIWAAGKYNTEIHNDSDYDADKYAPVRPTNPPDPSTRISEWRGGYEAPDAVTTTTTVTKPSSGWSFFDMFRNWGGRGGSGGTTTTTTTSTMDELTIEKGKTVSSAGKAIVSEKIAELYMPQIDDLEQYRTYAKTKVVTAHQLQPNGSYKTWTQIGGSLVCTNCDQYYSRASDRANYRQGVEYKVWPTITQTVPDQTKPIYGESKYEMEMKTYTDRRSVSSSQDRRYWEQRGYVVIETIQSRWSTTYEMGKPSTNREYVPQSDISKYEAMGYKKTGRTQQGDVIGYQDKTETTQPNGDSTMMRYLRSVIVKDGHTVVDPAGCGGYNSDLTGMDTKYLRPFEEKVDINVVEESGSGYGYTKTEHNYSDVDGSDCGINISAIKDAEEGSVILIGTWDCPIEIHGPVVFEKDVIIKGFVTGQGTIYAGRNIHIIGDIQYVDPPTWPHPDKVMNLQERRERNAKKDLLALICRGSIVVGNYNSGDWNTYVKKYIGGGYTRTGGKTYGNYYQNDATSSRQVAFKDADTKEQNGDWVWTTTSSWYKKDSNIGNTRYGYYKTETVPDRNNTGRFSSVTSFKKYETVLGNMALNGLSQETESGRLSDWMSKGLWWRLDRFSRILPFYFRSKGWHSYADRWRNSRASSFWKNFYDYWWKSHYAEYDVEDITRIDAVLYSSHGIFGLVGGEKTGCTINGAVIGQDECIFPYTIDRWTSRWSSKRSVINWDMRLKADSAERCDSMGLPLGIDKPYTMTWQEVPASFRPVGK